MRSPLKTSTVSDTTDTRADDADNRSTDPTLIVSPRTCMLSPPWTSMRPLVVRVTASALNETSSPDTASSMLAALMATLPSPTFTREPVLPTRTLSDPVTSTNDAPPTMRSLPSTTTEPPVTDKPSAKVALPAPPTATIAASITLLVASAACSVDDRVIAVATLLPLMKTLAAACRSALRAPAVTAGVLTSRCFTLPVLN